MELFQLEQFLAAARLQNLTRAAEELALTQPALSKNIKALERELGYPLFTREGRRLLLNDNGRILEKHAQRVFAALRDAEAELAESSRRRSLSVSLCVLAASNLIPKMLVEYKKDHPEISFSVLQRHPEDETRDPVDFVINASISPAAEEEGITLAREPLIVALPKTHRLAGRRSIDLAELKDEAFISLRRDFPLTQITQHYCRLNGFLPNVVFESDNPSTLRNIISLGTGVALIPSLTWDMRRYDSLALVPLTAGYSRCLILTYPRGRTLSPEKEDFLQYLVAQFSSLGKEKKQKEGTQ